MSILFGPQSTRIADVVDQLPTTVPKRNRPDRWDHEAGRQSDHHKRQHRMACDDAEQCRHQSILVLPSLASRRWPYPFGG